MTFLSHKVEIEPCPCGLDVSPHTMHYEVTRRGRFSYSIRMQHGPGYVSDPMWGEPSAMTLKRAIRKGERWLKRELRDIGAAA